MTETGNGLNFYLLGSPRITRHGDALNLSTSKGKAILFYLAVTQRPQSRATLAHLLWTEMPDKAARTNLRVTLSKLRPAAGEWLAISRDAVGWRPGAAVWSDVAAFEEACSGGGWTSWAAAVGLYRGEFLQSFAVSAAPAFEEWVLLEQERLHQQAHGALRQLVRAALADRARTADGIRYARRLLVLDPWREEAHRHLMRLLARNGQRGEALAQFETCRRVLAEEFGAEPAAETVALYERLQVGTVASERVPAGDRTQGDGGSRSKTAPHNLPAATTPFVGREEEVAEIDALLADPTCRLLTLVGPGGIGKTRLALEVAAAQRGRFADGVFLVPLAAAEPDPEANPLAPAMAAAVGFTFSGAVAPEEQVQHQLCEKEVLLLLDNVEHLIPYTGWLVTLLEQAPGLRLLVTSRESLNLYEEWLFEVRGLPVPAEDLTAGEGTLEAFASAALFVQRARRVNLRFDAEDAAEGAAVARICRLLGGVPLALELAAAWVRTLSCSEIADRIAENVDFLASQARNRPDRHQSLRAVFEHSWQLLDEVAQQALARLTVFRGGFTVEAAAAVAGADLRTLSRLVEKSLVQREANGRYDLHELLRQFAGERLDEAPVGRRHAHYFVDMLADQTQVLRGPEPETAGAVLEPEMSNIRAAWHWAAAEGEEEAMAAALLPLFELFDLRAWYREGEQLLRGAVAVVDDGCLAARLSALRARFLTRQGHLSEAETLVRASLDRLAQHDAREYGDALNNLNNILRRAGRYDEARAALDRAEEVYEEAGFRRGVASVLNNRGLAAYRQGDYDAAVALQQRSADLYRETGPRKDLATVLNNLGLSRLYQGQFAAAEAALQESATTAREIGYRGCLVVATQNLGAVAVQQKAWAAAESYLAQSLQLAEEVGVQDMAGHIHHDLCIFYLCIDRLEAARRHGETALALGEQLGMQWLAAAAEGGLADVALAEGKVDEAEERLRVGLVGAKALAAKALQATMLASWAEMLGRRGEVRSALAILAVVEPLLGDDAQRQARARDLLAGLRAEVDAGEWERIEGEAAGQSLETVLDGVVDGG